MQECFSLHIKKNLFWRFGEISDHGSSHGTVIFDLCFRCTQENIKKEIQDGVAFLRVETQGAKVRKWKSTRPLMQKLLDYRRVNSPHLICLLQSAFHSGILPHQFPFYHFSLFYFYCLSNILIKQPFFNPYIPSISPFLLVFRLPIFLTFLGMLLIQTVIEFPLFAFVLVIESGKF